MFHTPAGKVAAPQESGGSPRSEEKAATSQPSVRRSIGEWEAGSAQPKAKSSQASPKLSITQKIPSSLVARRLSAETADRLSKKPEVKFPSLTAEARACLSKAKLQLGNARNLKTEIKTEVLGAINRLYEIVKESERSKTPVTAAPTLTTDRPSLSSPSVTTDINRDLVQQLEANSALLRENLSKMELLQDALATKTIVEERTYASVAAANNSQTGAQALGRATLHSVVVSSTEEKDTGDEVLERVRRAIDAKEGWVQVEKIRKAKDRKVIMGCRTKEERSKIKQRLEELGGSLVVEEVKNRDPLLILRDVMVIHSDEDVLRALRNQNPELFNGLEGEDQRIEIKFRRKARNPHTNHVVCSVSPLIWRRAIEAVKVRIDLMKVRVEDQTPLVQCTRCLGYGHSKRFCKLPADLCSHCGGPHLRADCPDKLIGEAAACVNCARAKMGNTEHNAFSTECPVRKRWDALARASIAYC